MVVVVPNNELCTLCSKISKQRYFIFKDMTKIDKLNANFIPKPGTVKDVVESIFGENFAPVIENCGSHICISCKKDAESWLNHKQKLDRLSTKFNANSQKLKSFNSVSPINS